MRSPGLIGLAAIAASLPGALCGAYLGALGALGGSRRGSPRGPAPETLNHFPLIAVLVPAHNEENNVAATVSSLLATDYPALRLRVLVVADNCRDETASVARGAGASVLERRDAVRRGKGYALAAGFEHVLADPTVDAVAVVDADTSVSANLFREMACAFQRGDDVVQADYGVSNAMASWRTRLMVIALSCFHGVRSTARERLALSCGLRGTGMGFTRAALVGVPHDSTGLVEDVEYGIALGLAGHRVAYLGAAHVRAEMPSTAAAATSQRDRWEHGRRQLIRRWGPSLARAAPGNRVAADLLADLLVPPLAQLVATLLVVGSVGAVLASSGVTALPVALSATGLAGVCLYVTRGWQLSATGLRGLRDLVTAPAYVGWKLGSKVLGRAKPRRDNGWVRTAREPLEGNDRASERPKIACLTTTKE